MRQRLLRVLGGVAVVFGLITANAGAGVLFGDAGSRGGPVVPFVVWFNFLASFAYVGAGVGLLAGKPWSARVAFAVALATALVFALFGLHVAHGGDFAMRTVAAMTLRAGFWIAVAWLARRAFRAAPAGARS